MAILALNARCIVLAADDQSNLFEFGEVLRNVHGRVDLADECAKLERIVTHADSVDKREKELVALENLDKDVKSDRVLTYF